MKELTTQELRTLCLMCQREAARIAMTELGNGREPSQNKQRQCIISISRKAYSELISRD